MVNRNEDHLSKAALTTPAGNPIVFQGSLAFASKLILKRFQVMGTVAPKGWVYVVDHDCPDLVVRESSDDTAVALLPTQAAAAAFAEHLGKTPFKHKFNHMAVLKTLRPAAERKPTVAKQPTSTAAPTYQVFAPKTPG